MITLLTGFTRPPTIYLKFVTKCDKCYYKVRQLFYYKVRWSVITKCDSFFYYKVRQLFYYKVRQVLLQSATGFTKCDDYYKVQPLKSTHCSRGQHLDDNCSIKYDCIQSGLFCLWGSDRLETLDKICLLQGPQNGYDVTSCMGIACAFEWLVDISVRNRGCADFSKRKMCENWSKTNIQHLLNAEKILNCDGKKSPGKKIMQNN